VQVLLSPTTHNICTLRPPFGLTNALPGLSKRSHPVQRLSTRTMCDTHTTLYAPFATGRLLISHP